MPESLEMLVTGDPVAEIDAALARAATRLRAARACGDTLAARRLTAWVDYRLDQRLAFDYRCRRAPAHAHPAAQGVSRPAVILQAARMTHPRVPSPRRRARIPGRGP